MALPPAGIVAIWPLLLKMKISQNKNVLHSNSLIMSYAGEGRCNCTRVLFKMYNEIQKTTKFLTITTSLFRWKQALIGLRVHHNNYNANFNIFVLQHVSL